VVLAEASAVVVRAGRSAQERYWQTGTRQRRSSNSEYTSFAISLVVRFRLRRFRNQKRPKIPQEIFNAASSHSPDQRCRMQRSAIPQARPRYFRNVNVGAARPIPCGNSARIKCYRRCSHTPHIYRKQPSNFVCFATQPSLAACASLRRFDCCALLEKCLVTLGSIV
jgi:hypothetical protein